MTGYALDEIERVLAGNRALTMPDRALYGALAGAGEWDWLRALPRRTRRRLAGAGYLTATGERPDVLADMICANVPGVSTSCDAMAWYVATALRAIIEGRRESHRHRHARFARSKGHATYYAYRRAVALEHGHGSVWHMRKDRGWT